MKKKIKDPVIVKIARWLFWNGPEFTLNWSINILNKYHEDEE